jgi:hypothetical protein
MFYFEPLTRNLPGGPRETVINFSLYDWCPAEIRTLNLPNKNKKRSAQNQLTR